MRLSIFYRFLLYGFLGICIEFLFTCFSNLIFHGDLKLTGKSYFYMLIIWGVGLLLLEWLNTFGWWINLKWYYRGGLYCIGFFIFEIIGGLSIELIIGQIPWDYSDAYCSVFNGLIRLDYTPLWFLTGLMLEKIFPIVKRIRISKLPE